MLLRSEQRILILFTVCFFLFCLKITYCVCKSKNFDTILVLDITKDMSVCGTQNMKTLQTK